MTLRLRGSKTELEEMGEDVTDMATTTSQLQAKLLALTGGQVDIMLDENTFKNSTQILREMAEAWEDMTDIQRASALELMGGKRQANVLSALIQNFDTVEEAIEASANSAGSALKENERYLDSIQGKIDQFNNALQSMWSNFLSDDFIKFIVEFGTELIKAADGIGLFGTLIVVLTGSKLIPWILNSITGMSTFGESLKYVGTMMTRVDGTGAALTATIITQTKALWGASVAGNVFTKSIKTLRIAFKALMATPLGWLLAIGAAVALATHLFDVFTTTTAELKEELSDLQSELKDIRSNLEAVNSELETTNERMAELLAKDQLSFVEEEELKALKKRNEELQREIDLLELKEKQTKKDTANKFVETIESDVNASGGFTNEYTRENDKIRKVKWYDWVTNFSEMFNPIDSKATEDDYIQQQVARYRELQKEIEAKEKEILGVNGDDNKSKKKREKLEKQKNKLTNEEQAIESYINSKTTEWNELSEELDYGISTETDAWLDYINNMQDKWAIASDGKNAKTNAINRILNKDQYASVSESIDGYVEALKNGDESARGEIDSIIRNNADLVADLQASGIKINEEINEATDYFTSFASEANYATIDDKLKEVEEATKRLKTALSGDFDTSSLDAIKQALTDKGWVDAEGNLVSDVIAEYFGGEDGGISEETRAEIERLVKQIYDGKISVQDALKSFELFSVQSIIDIQIAEVKTNFKDVFVDLEDVDGLINTFEELGTAIGSTVGALEAFNQAQADVADKGFVSIQTALQLMEYTDDYSSVLQVVNGKLQLAENAEENLIQARINAIKVSAQTAVADAQAAYDKAELAVQSYRSAMVEETSASTVATAWQKIVATAAGIKNALDNIWSGDSIGDLYNAGYNTYLESATGYKTTYDDTGLQALEDALADADQKLNEAKGNAEIANVLSADSLEDLYKSSDKSTKEEVEDDAFQREMDYWENRIAANQAKYGQLQNEIDRLESRGQKAGAGYYEEQIKLEGQRFSLLKKQKAAAQSHLATLKEGSDEWWEAAEILNGIEDDLDGVTVSIVDLQDAIGDVETYKFEEFNTRLDNLANRLGSIRDLIAPDGEEDWFDEEGNWTEKGVAALGTYVQELEFFKQGYQDTVDEIAKYQSEYAGNEDYYETLGIHSEQELYDKQQDLIDQQYDYAESISNSEQSIVDMYKSSIDATEEYFDTLIDNYNDYIDSVKDALDAERDYTLCKQSYSPLYMETYIMYSFELLENP